MPAWLAGALVFYTSAAVLVLEILAGRLLAPYVGIRLETYTAVIGTVLAGISVGTWVGGRLADRVDPRRTLGPLLVGGGTLAMLSVPVVRAVGTVGDAQSGQTLGLTILGFLPSAAVLSAVSPTVVKLQLHDLSVTGTVVGRLSAIGTAGAIAGTFLAGFVLVAAAATSTVILALGGSLVVAGFALWVVLARPRPTPGTLAAVLAVVLGAAGLSAASNGPCDVETRYHCARVVTDPQRPSGRALHLDVLRHSYVDLEDASYLELRYARVFADVIVDVRPGGEGGRLDALHIGGGGFTMPRFLGEIFPGSRHLVFEVDPDLVDLAEEQLGLRQGPDLRVQVGDARLLQRRVPRDSVDVVVGDAFGDLAVPWHLATREFVTDIDRVLRPEGLYILNLIDYPPLRFARAEVATLARVFDHVTVIAPREFLDGVEGGNYVIAASDRPFDGAVINRRIADRSGGEAVINDPDEIAAFAEDGTVLTDDYAPVDQWLARSRSR